MSRALEPEEVAFDLEEAYAELRRAAEDMQKQEQRDVTHAEWETLVDEILEGKMDYETLEEGGDWTDQRDKLVARYDEYMEEISERA